MYQKWNRYKILAAFFDEPNRKWQLRQLERTVGLGLPTVKSHVEALLDEHLIKLEDDGIYKSYRAAMNDEYRTYKLNDLLVRLRSCGLIRELEEKCTPNCIVLYGSGAAGRDDERGDIDLYIESTEKKIDMAQYEKYLHRKISLMFDFKAEKLNPEFKNTIANGIVLSGFLKVS